MNKKVKTILIIILVIFLLAWTGLYLKSLLNLGNAVQDYEEANNLISEAKRLSSENKAANNGKGVYVGYLETEDHYEIQVQRIFNELKQ